MTDAEKDAAEMADYETRKVFTMAEAEQLVRGVAAEFIRKASTLDLETDALLAIAGIAEEVAKTSPAAWLE